MLHSIRKRAALLVLVLSPVAACSGTDGGEPDAGFFTATVTAGGQPVQLQGFASSGGFVADERWSAQLITPEGSGFVLVYAGAARPPVGSHTIADFAASDAEAPPGQFIITGNANPGSGSVLGLQSVSGTLVISASTSSSVEGAFQYQATPLGGGTAVTVVGEFRCVHQER